MSGLASCADWNTGVFFEAEAEQLRGCLDAGADPNTVDGLGRTPLHWAADGRHRVDSFGNTPLHWAVDNDAPATVICSGYRQHSC